jgi:septal ring factor EnvC (AmiA/AmiB activator)
MSAHAVGVTYRWVAILMTVVAALGWGVLFVLSPSAASVHDALRQEIDRLVQERQRLDALVKEQRATTAELSELTTKLATTRDDLARMKEAHEAAQAALVTKKAEFTSTQAAIATARTELAALEQRMASTREQVSERTGTVKAGKSQRRKVSLRRKKRGRS